MAMTNQQNQNNQLTTLGTNAGTIMEEVVAKGDLKELSPEQRATYYTNVCKSMGLNPFTKPFEYITLNSKLTLYATRTAADQLRKINGVSITNIEREIVDDLVIVTVKVADKTGRTDEEVGAVSFGALKGEAKANAIMKAITKAKRRATLSICGLGWLDETEVETIPTAAPVTVDVQTGEIEAPRQSRQERPQQPIAAQAMESPEPSQQTLTNASDDWQSANRKLHAVAAEVISKDTHVAHHWVHIMAGLKGRDSVSKLTVDELHKMADFIQSDQFADYAKKFIEPKLGQAGEDGDA